MTLYILYILYNYFYKIFKKILIIIIINNNDILIKEEKSHKQPFTPSNIQPTDYLVFNQNFDNFILSQEQYNEKKSNIKKKNEEMLKFINAYAAEKGYIKLKSDYLGIDHYYYDNKIKRMYKITPRITFDNKNPVFELSNDLHILKLNKL